MKVKKKGLGTGGGGVLIRARRSFTERLFSLTKICAGFLKRKLSCCRAYELCTTLVVSLIHSEPKRLGSL